jgi:methionine-rich copper-binding protein CopC
MSSRFPSRSIATLAAAAAAVLLAAATQAQAHAHLVSATPAANATTAPPKMLVLHFSERLEPNFSGVEVFKADGGKAPVTSEILADDRKTIIGKVTSPLAPGVYQVRWRTVAADSHRMAGAYSFTVR